MGGTLWRWSYREQRLEKLYEFQGTIVGAARWSPDGRWLAAWNVVQPNSDQMLLIWDSESDQPACGITLAYADRIREVREVKKVAWSPDSQHLVILLNDVRIGIWHVNAPVAELYRAVGAETNGVEFVDTNRFVTWGSADVTRVWSVDGTQTQAFGIAEDQVQGVVIHDRQHLLTFLRDGGAFLWEIKSGQRLMKFCCHAKRVVAAAWHRDGYLATSSLDGTAQVWDLATGAARHLTRPCHHQ